MSLCDHPHSGYLSPSEAISPVKNLRAGPLSPCSESVTAARLSPSGTWGNQALSTDDSRKYSAGFSVSLTYRIV